MLKAVILDFDGIIIDSETIWFDIFNKWFKDNHQYDLPITEFTKCVGSEKEDLFIYLEDKYDFEIDRKKFEHDTIDLFIELTKDIPVMDGIEDFIKVVKKHNLKLGLCTSATIKKPTYHLNRLDLMKYFDAITTADDVERIKPFPDLYENALKKLNVKPNEVIVIEDSYNGLLSANSAGIKTIVVPNYVTKHFNFEEAFMIKNSVKEIDLKGLIKTWE